MKKNEEKYLSSMKHLAAENRELKRNQESYQKSSEKLRKKIHKLEEESKKRGEEWEKWKEEAQKQLEDGKKKILQLEDENRQLEVTWKTKFLGFVQGVSKLGSDVVEATMKDRDGGGSGRNSDENGSRRRIADNVNISHAAALLSIAAAQAAADENVSLKRKFGNEICVSSTSSDAIEAMTKDCDGGGSGSRRIADNVNISHPAGFGNHEIQVAPLISLGDRDQSTPQPEVGKEALPGDNEGKGSAHPIASSCRSSDCSPPCTAHPQNSKKDSRRGPSSKKDSRGSWKAHHETILHHFLNQRFAPLRMCLPLLMTFLFL